LPLIAITPTPFTSFRLMLMLFIDFAAISLMPCRYADVLTLLLMPALRFSLAIATPPPYMPPEALRHDTTLRCFSL